MLDTRRQEIFNTAVGLIASSVGKPSAAAGLPVLFGPNNKPLAPATPQFGISRTAAKRQGSMKKWIPKRLLSRQQEALEREAIADRATDLVNSDPNASGMVNNFATTVIGAGLIPHIAIDPDSLGLPKEKIRVLQAQQRAIFNTWTPFADAGGRMSFGAIQFLVKRSLFQFGEYLVVLPMIKSPLRPYSLACQVIHPLRLKTPIDKINQSNIRDGVELGDYGEPAAYWIKKASRGVYPLSDNSVNFLRIPAKVGHRWNVLHGFVQTEPEQVRGVSRFAPAMKMFRDLSDYLDAELVSNIVTAAFALFIETGSADPYTQASNLAGFSETITGSDGTQRTNRYQEFQPGMIMYGNSGEKPHAIAANRPGATFDPFTRVIKKAIAASVNLPYPVAWKDVDGLSFAGWRGAMLEAWRVFSSERQWLGEQFCQPVNTMLQEEAYLRGRLDIEDFYENMWALTRAQWRGYPKGDIEPVKAVQADLLAIEGNLKTREEAISERGGDPRTTFDKLEEEQEILEQKKLNSKKSAAGSSGATSTAKEDSAIIERLDQAIDLLEEMRS